MAGTLNDAQRRAMYTKDGRLSLSKLKNAPLPMVLSIAEVYGFHTTKQDYISFILSKLQKVGGAYGDANPEICQYEPLIVDKPGIFLSGKQEVINYLVQQPEALRNDVKKSATHKSIYEIASIVEAGKCRVFIIYISSLEHDVYHIHEYTIKPPPYELFIKRDMLLADCLATLRKEKAYAISPDTADRLNWHFKKIYDNNKYLIKTTPVQNPSPNLEPVTTTSSEPLGPLEEEKPQETQYAGKSKRSHIKPTKPARV